MFTAVKIAIRIKDNNEYFINFKKLSELTSSGLVLFMDVCSHLVQHGVNNDALFCKKYKHKF